MISKLYSHELKSLLRYFFIVWIIVFVLAVINRAIFEYGEAINISANVFEGGKRGQHIFKVVYGTSAIIYLFGVLALFLTCLLGSIARFYKSMFTGEGYMAFSFPISNTNLLLCKALSAVIMCFASLLLIVISGIIVGLGTPFFEDLLLYIKASIEVITAVETTIDFSDYVLQYVILMAITLVSSILQYYLAICCGQMFKHKIVGALLCYLIIYLVLQLILLAVIGGMFFVISNVRVPIKQLIHGLLTAITIIQVGLIVLFFFLTLRWLNKKLDLTSK